MHYYIAFVEILPFNAEDKIETLKTLSAHLNNIIKDKDVLISYLQQPFAGDFVVVEADNQQ